MYKLRKQKQYQYIPKTDFYLKGDYYTQTKIKNNTIYMYSQPEKAMLIVQLFALHGQQKIVKKMYLELKNFYFMNQGTELVSCDCGSIQIWRLDHKYNYAKKTILQDNWNDDLIVSSTLNGALLFWKKNIDWKCYQNLQVEWGLKNLNLNQKGDRLIATNTSAIYLFSTNPYFKQSQWSQQQKIDKYSDKLCFIDDAKFACISYDEKILTVYEVSAELKQYQNIQLYGKITPDYSLIEFQQEKQLLIVKTDNRLLLIQKKCRGKYVVQDKLQVSIEELTVTFNKNGDYLLLDFFCSLSSIKRKIQLRRSVAVD